MAYNTEDNVVSPVQQGLVNTGADLLKNLYDINIKFPILDGGWFTLYPLAARANGFSIPDIGVETYDIEYQGQKLSRTSGKSNMEKKFTITFREDANLYLRRLFTTWHSYINDVGNGGMSNTIGAYGVVSVATMAGVFTALDWNSHHSGYGGTLSSSDSNPLLAYTFFHAWPSKVGGIKFETSGSGANTFDVEFIYEYCNIPFAHLTSDGTTVSVMSAAESMANAAGAWDSQAS